MATRYSLRDRKPKTLKEPDVSEEEVQEEQPSKKQKTKKGAAPRKRGKKGEQATLEKPTGAPSPGEASTTHPSTAVEEKPKEVTEGTKEGGHKEAHATEEKHKGAHKEDLEHPPKALEKGHIYFFYRPKVGLETAEGIEDVQKLYLILAPEGTNKKRVIIIPKKMLPNISSRDRFFAMVDLVTEKWDETVDEAIGETTYKTKTRGERHLHGATPCGEGSYAIVKHHDRHTHLAFVLEVPSEIGEIQEAFHIPQQGSYVLTVKNPQAPSYGFGGARIAPDLPKELQDRFEGRRFNPVDPPEFLDHEGIEMIIIGASENVSLELGLPGEEIKERVEAEKLTSDSLFKELHISKKEHPPKPLVTGKWKE